ncbi:SpoIIE family protein phosphatase [Nonomuraea pusilla]|uniref:protein-serine/threonine phosphatase n=1 Tax=Nonomuraea pusilla TaxID=46177 RepID=A0A1H7TTA3_9ACTN|nr:SpoIIE family protein phosphatase [Nonomuraea pusilla]SEL87729.1 PAS fold-containing protein [Nonomuraea pusilla]
MPGEVTPLTGDVNGSYRLDELLLEAIETTGAHVGAVYLLDESGQVLQMTTQTGLPEPIANGWARLRVTGPVPVALAVRERRLVWLADQEDLARRFPATALAFPYRFAVGAAPLHDGGDWGALMLLWPPGHASRLTARKLDAIHGVCGRMAELLRGAAERGHPVRPAPQPRTLTPVRARKTDPRTETAALDCLSRLPEGYVALDVEGRVTLVTPPAAQLLGTTGTHLLGTRPWEALPWLDDPAFEDRYRAAVIGHQVTFFTARRPTGQWLAFQLYPGLAGLSVRITPSTMARDPGHLMPDPPAAVVRPDRVIALHDMLHLATSLARAVTEQEVIDLVADQVMPVYNVQALAILTTQNGRMRVAASRGYSRRALDEFDGLPFQAPSPAGHPLTAGRPAFFSTWHELRETYPNAIRSDGMSAWAFLPLVTTGRPLGMCVLAYDRPHSFSVDERATLTSLAGLVAQAFERARLYDVKHQLAQCLQSSLLPRTLPRVPGLDVAARYLPATPGMDIGGDFYDLIRLGDSMAAAVIGDVQGHDVTAAALMGQVRTAIHAQATAGAAPGDVLAHTNRLLMDLSPDRFTSCLYISLDLRGRLACLASAGHPPPLLHVPDAPTQVVDTAPGLLLGIDRDAEYSTLEVPMPPGSVLALYTDGLVEAPGRPIGEAISELARRFSPSPDQPLHDLADALIDPVAAVEHRKDDTAMLLLRVMEGAGRP